MKKNLSYSPSLSMRLLPIFLFFRVAKKDLTSVASYDIFKSSNTSQEDTEMTELNWDEHREQMNRQLKWQQVRNSFYSNICYHAKNAAAHERAFGGPTYDSAQEAAATGDLHKFRKHQSEERRAKRITERIAECRDAEEFYNTVVIPHDAAIKQAQRDGNAELYKTLLDQANEIIQGMHQHTHLGLEHDAI